MPRIYRTDNPAKAMLLCSYLIAKLVGYTLAINESGNVYTITMTEYGDRWYFDYAVTIVEGTKLP